MTAATAFTHDANGELFHGGRQMDSLALDTHTWTHNNFGSCDFNDQRLSSRLVKYAGAVTARPDDKTPQQTQTWKDCKGAYRFMDNDKVTFAEIIRPHCEATRAYAQNGIWPSLCDTTEVSFRPRRNIDGLRPVGNGTGQGFYLHTSLMVADDSDEIMGIAAQELYYRIDAQKNDNTAKRKKRERESEAWGRVADAVSKPLHGALIIHVCDRGTDDYDFFSHVVQNQAGWVVRASRLTRKVIARSIGELEPQNAANLQPLEAIVDSLPPLGTYQLELK